MADGQTQTAFDPVAEYRKNWTDDQRSDEEIAVKLQDPANFRKAFPDYDYSAPDADKRIQKKMLDYYAHKYTLPRSQQVSSIEKEQIGKGFITPEREKELVEAVQHGASPLIIPFEKYGVTPEHVLSEGWEGLKDVGRAGLSVVKDISNPQKPLFFGKSETESPEESTFHKYILRPSEEQFRRAREGGQSAIESIGHSVAGALPVIGPAAAAIAEQAGTGDVGGAIGRGAGQAAGAKLLSKVPDILPRLEVNAAEMGRGLIEGDVRGVNVRGPRAIEGVPARLGRKLTPEQAAAMPPAAEFQPALGNTAREVLEHAAKEGIELTPGQATNMPLPRMVQAIGERSLFGADKLAQGIDRNAGAFMKATRGFADRMDPKAMGLSEEAAGEAIKQATETGKNVTHENAQAGFKALEPYGKTAVDTSAISKKWIDLREGLPRGAEEQILSEVPRNMAASVEEMLSPTGMKATLPFEKAIALRSLFRELGESDTLPTKAQGAFRQMTKAIDSAMESAAKEGGFEKAWREGNRGWKDYAEKYGDKQSPLVRILRQADPAKITRDLLNRASAKDIEILRNEKLDAALEPLKRQVIEEIAKNKFTVGRSGLGGFSHSFLNTLFGPEALKELYLKADIGRRFNWQMNPSGTSNVMMAETQVAHPEPSKLGLLYGAARTSMPRAATSYLPEIAPEGIVRPIAAPSVPAAPGGGRRENGGFRGGINIRGVEQTLRPIDTQTNIRGLSNEIETMKEKLRNAAGRPKAEKDALERQIEDYQGRLDELRRRIH